MKNYASVLPGTKSTKRVLRPGAVPSQFPWSRIPSENMKARVKRAKTRLEKRNIEPDLNDGHLYEEEVVAEHVEEDVPMEQEREHKPARQAPPIATQTPPKPRISTEELMFFPRDLHYYTGLKDYDKFRYVLATLGPAAYHLKYRWGTTPSMTIENQFLVTLMKLRRNAPDSELAFWLSTSDYTIANITVTWINFMYRQWKRLDTWPSRELVSFYMPEDFRKKFPTTRAIIDGVEVPIKKPGKPTAQQVTYSTYKNRNTLKAIIGITPGGLVSHIPPAFGGSASDRILVDRSDLMEKCDPKDSLMADKGFNIQDMAAPHDVTVNIPTFVRNINQIQPSKLKKDRKISSKRVHVERLIGLAKTYRILTEPMNDVDTALGSRILFVCFMLCNFRPCIVPTTS